MLVIGVIVLTQPVCVCLPFRFPHGRTWVNMQIAVTLTGIAGLVHVKDLNLMTQILIFPCQTCSVYAMKQFGYPPKIFHTNRKDLIDYKNALECL